jgi:nucleobase:cation symporter-1, NCS1 family
MESSSNKVGSLPTEIGNSPFQAGSGSPPESAEAKVSSSLIERRSIDYIPESERHGRLINQLTLWLGANLQLPAVITGALAVVLGGDVVWSLVGLLVGQIIGGATMAAHGAQGPRLGVPQMISSRVQFGVYGATIPLVLACVMYLGFSASGAVLSAQSLSQALHISTTHALFLFPAAIILLSTIGYRAVHVLGRLSTVVGISSFLYLFGSLLYGNDVNALLSNRHFVLSHFLLAVSLSASWQISYGPYVADYSRYLPRNVSGVKAFLMIFLGTIIGTQISMTFGVFAAALAGDRFAGHEVSFIVGLGSTGAIAVFLYLAITLSKLTNGTLSAYGCVMSVITIGSAFGNKRAVSVKTRVSLVVLMVITYTTIAYVLQDRFLSGFFNFILFLLSAFTPWSAINLVDFYFVTRERYDIPALFDADGRYGRWNLRGLLVYVVGIVVQTPFIATDFYTGPLFSKLGYIDISWIVGFIVPAILYYLVSRNSTVPRELILPESN